MAEKKQHSIRETLSLLDQHLSVDAGGRIRGEPAVDTQLKVIATLRQFDSDIAPVEQQDVVKRAVFEIVRKGRGRLDEEAFDEALRKQVAELKERPVTIFDALGWVACSPSNIPPEIMWRSTTLEFGKHDLGPLEHLPSIAKIELASILEPWRDVALTSVQFSVKGRSETHATHRAQNVFSELRGCIDLLISYRQVHWLFWGIPTHPNWLPAHPILMVRPREGDEE